jgi:histidine ammonia-lyase
MMMKQKKTLDGESLTIEDIINIAENGYEVEIPKPIEKGIKEKRKKLEDQLEKYPEIKIYGTNRLHGDLKDVDVGFGILEKYQEKYIKVHNCGTGVPVSEKIVRAIMAIRLNSFAKGLSGMRWETVQLLMDMLNNHVTPLVLEEGSVGASGDLIPLAMIGAVMIGLKEAQAYYHSELLPASEALKRGKLKPIKLGAKEAMGLTNGSNFITAFAVFAIRDAENLIEHASIAGALSLEAIRGEKDAFSETINDNRPHKGQLQIAQKIRLLVEDSKRMTPEAQTDPFNHKESLEEINKLLEKHHNNLSAGDKKNLKKLAKEYEWEERVQDRYSFRAIPQVHGTVIESVEKLKEVVKIEINSATDNPLFKEVDIQEMKVGIKDEIYKKLKNDNVKKLIKGFSGANFHGQPLATAIDYLKIALTSLGLISDKRSFSLLSEKLSYGLPANLAFETQNADGGLMILQYAGAARAAENRALATPSSVMSISTAANQEDFVSMGANGALHLRKIIENTEKIIAFELLCALRGIQLTYDKLPEHLRNLGKGSSKIYQYLSANPKLKASKERLEDHYLQTDMEEIISILKSGELVKLVEVSKKANN